MFFLLNEMFNYMSFNILGEISISQSQVPLVESTQSALANAKIKGPPMPITLPHRSSGKGNKHDNSVRVRQFVASLNDSKVSVPILEGVKSNAVVSFLQEQGIKDKLITHWKALSGLYATAQQEKKTASFWQDPKIRQRITDTQKILVDRCRNGIIAFPLPSKVMVLLTGLAKEKKQVIVRSSGDEDGTREEGGRVGAGVHKSVGFVIPSRKEVVCAIGQVLASYFSLKAMESKSREGSNPFTRLPVLSVMVQEHIAETQTEIPVAAVLMTTDPTLGAFSLIAAPGFGDGVTDGQVACDTAIVVPSAAKKGEVIEYYENQTKDFRLVGGEKRVKNSPTVATRRALSPKMVQKIFTISKKLETFFGRPMDVELVVMGDKIHIVQARPIDQEPVKRAYLKLLKEPEGVMHFHTIVPGLCRPVLITDPKQLLTTATLQKADEGEYQQGLHRFIMAKKRDGKYSHAAISFSSMKPSVSCGSMAPDEIDQLVKLAAQCSIKQPLILCPQTKRALLWDPKAGDPKSLITEGLTELPTGVNPSLNLSQNTLPQVDGQIEIPSAIQSQLARAGSSEGKALEATKQLHQYWVSKIVPLKSAKGYRESHYRQVAAALDAKAQAIFTELNALPNDSQHHLQRLLHVDMLRKLIAQPSDHGNALSAYSLHGLQGEIEAQKLANAYLKKVPEGIFAKEANLGRHALVSEVGDAWVDFLVALSSAKNISKEDLVRLQRMLSMLDNVGAIPSWMTTAFDYNRKVEKKPETLLKTLLSDYREDEIPLLSRCLHYEKTFSAFKARATTISDEASLKKYWDDLEKALAPFHKTHEKFIGKSYRRQSDIAETMMLRVLEKLADLMDVSIKETKLCGALEGAPQVQFIRSKVDLFAALLQTWAPTVISDGRSIHYADAVKKLRKNLSQTQDNPAQLRPSRGFSVLARRWGADVGSYGGPAKTVEDFFSLVHQNFLVAISRGVERATCGKITSREVSLPPSVAAFLTALEGASNLKKYEPSCTGITIDSTGLHLRYNMPVQTHSCVFEFTCSRSRPPTLRVQVVGWMETRGRGVRDYARLASAYHGHKSLEGPSINIEAGVVDALWEVQSNEEISKLLAIFAEMTRLTFARSYNSGVAKEWWKTFGTNGKGVEWLINHILSDTDHRNSIHYLMTAKGHWLIDVFAEKKNLDKKNADQQSRLIPYITECARHTPGTAKVGDDRGRPLSLVRALVRSQLLPAAKGWSLAFEILDKRMVERSQLSDEKRRRWNLDTGLDMLFAMLAKENFQAVNLKIHLLKGLKGATIEREKAYLILEAIARHWRPDLELVKQIIADLSDPKVRRSAFVVLKEVLKNTDQFDQLLEKTALDLVFQDKTSYWHLSFLYYFLGPMFKRGKGILTLQKILKDLYSGGKPLDSSRPLAFGSVKDFRQLLKKKKCFKEIMDVALTLLRSKKGEGLITPMEFAFKLFAEIAEIQPKALLSNPQLRSRGSILFGSQAGCTGAPVRV